MCLKKQTHCNEYKRVINLLITRKNELCINGQHIVGKNSLFSSVETGALLIISLQWAYHKDHRFRQSSTMYAPRAWQI